MLAPNAGWVPFAVPFVLLLVVGLTRLLLGPGYGLLPLLAIGPGSAAAIGGPLFALAVGGAAIGEAALIGFAVEPDTPHKAVVVAFIAIAGVTIGGAVASHIRRRREQDLLEVQAVAEVTQRVVLRPVPDRVGGSRLAARYLSASAWARVGGDLYAAVPTSTGLRLIVGDAEGKGLAAVQEAAMAMNSFRAVAHQESTLAGVAARMEATLNRELGDEQFVTAVLAEVSPDGSTMEIINCGHPRPLQLSPRGTRYLGPEDGSVPLGLGLGVTDCVPFTIPLRPGEPVLFYTDGLTEARNRSGEFFPLAESSSVQAPADLPTLLDRLCAEVSRYAGHRPRDDIALLLIERTAPSW